MAFSTIAFEDLIASARKLLSALGEGSMSESAYDTAWVARIQSLEFPGEPRYPAAYDWLLREQRTDGSWGGEIAFPHDRVMSTLAVLVALTESSYRKAES